MKKVTLTWTCPGTTGWFTGGGGADMLLNCGAVWQTEHRAIEVARGGAKSCCLRCGTFVSIAHGSRPKCSEMYEEYSLPDLPPGHHPVAEGENAN
jgi:hypothetical protein